MSQTPPLFVLAAVYDSGGLSASRLTVGDLNGDGQPDLVVANQCHTCSPGTVGVLLGNSDGTFQPSVDYSSGAWNPWSVAIKDVNGDGKPDLVVANVFFCSTRKVGAVTVATMRLHHLSA